MATVCYINVYNSHMDRGVTVSKTPQEHYEVDESGIIVGKPLPKLNHRNIVKSYDDNELVLWMDGGPAIPMYENGKLVMKDRSKTFTIKVGEEVEVACSEHDVGMGVKSRNCYCVKLIGTELTYKGGWQRGNTILQKLAGPIGDGEVWYPNGDHFKGAFHLSYASINGPAYAADGRYDFADGSYIERAWIHTSKDRKPEWWGLHGVFRIHHPEGPDSIAMFLHGGKRYGFELFLPEKSWQNPWVREWYAGDRVIRYSGPDELFQYEVVDYEIDETSKKDCTTLKLTLKDGDKVYRIEQQGGRYVANQYDDYIYEPSTRVTVELPNGDSLDHYGDDVRDFQPYDGFVYVHCAATGKYRREHWQNGVLTDDEEWKYDERAAKKVTLPDPTGVEGELDANIWADGHIVYGYDEWVYDGEVKNNRPDGQGVLVGDRRHGERRFEGLFADGVYQSQEQQFEGEITLHVKSGHKSWTVYNDGDWKYSEEDIIAKRGRLNLDGFWGYEITSIKQDCITIEYYDMKYQVHPDKPLHLHNSIEGDERSDGCVYDGDDYNLELTWVKSTP